MELFRLFGSIMIDDQDAIKTLNKVDNKGKTTGQRFMDIAKKGAKIGAAVVGGATAATAALYGVANKAAGAGDRIDKMSQRLGMSRSAFQEWDFILSQSGSSIESMEQGMKTLTQRMQDSADGTGKGAEAFDKLGVSVLDANGNMKDQEDIFEESIRALQEMEEGAEKSALANDLFGRSGQELLPLLNGQRGSIDELREKYEELGIEMSDDAVDAGVKFTDTMDQLRRTMGFVFSMVGVKVLPIFQQMADWVIEHMPQIQAVTQKVFDAITFVVVLAADIFRNHFLPIIISVYEFFRDNFPLMRDIATQAFTGIQSVWENVLKPAFNSLLDFVGNIVDNFNEYLLPALVSFYEWIQSKMPTIKNVISTTFETARTMIDNAREAVATITQFIKEHWAVFGPILAGVAGAIGVYKAIAIAMGLWTAATTLWTTVTTIATTVAGGFAAAVAFLTSPIGIVVVAIGAAIAIGVALYRNWETVSSKATELWSTIKTRFNDIKTAIMNPINEARDAVSNAIEAMKGFFNFNWSLPKIKMPSFSVSGSANPLNWLKEGVPKLSVNWNAKGGIFDKPTIFNTPQGLQGVGEAGPEAILPLNDKTYAGMGKGIAEALSKMTQPQAVQDDRPIYIQLDGKTIAVATRDHLDEQNGQKVNLVNRRLTRE